MALTNYSTTPANNSDAPPNGAPEGMLASSVNETMRQIMADIKGGVSFKVDTIADMTALDTGKLSNNNTAFAAGYYVVGDGGGGTFYWDSTNTDTSNGGTIIDADGTGRWIRIYDELTILMFGAKNDGSEDFGPVLQSAVDVVTASGEVLILSAGTYLQTTAVVKDNFDALTIIGYGATVDFRVHFALTLGDLTTDGSGYFTQLTPTIKNVHIEGIQFVSSVPGYDSGTNRYSYKSPLEVSAVDGFKVINCHFEDYDFAAINISAQSKNIRVKDCTFRANEESDVTYGVRPFNFVAPLDNYDDNTGLLLYTAPTNSFHEDVIVEGCEFYGLARSIISWNVHNSKYINNTFNKPLVRCISVTNWNFDSLISGNTHNVEDNVEETLSTCINVGVGSERVKIVDEFFQGTVSNTGVNADLKVVGCGGANKDITIDNCTFNVTGVNVNVNLNPNIGATINNNKFLTDCVGSTICPIIINANAVASPGFDQPEVVISKNKDMLNSRFVNLLSDPAGTAEHIVIKDNDLRTALLNNLVTTNTTGIWKVKARDNVFVAGTATYVVDNGTGKTKFAYADSFEVDIPFATTSGIGTGASESVSQTIEEPPEIFDLNGYLFSAWGGGENAQPIGEFTFVPTTLDRTTVAGDITRDTGTISFQFGHASVKTLFTPTHGV